MSARVGEWWYWLVDGDSDSESFRKWFLWGVITVESRTCFTVTFMGRLVAEITIRQTKVH